jgi:hypothetical protein
MSGATNGDSLWIGESHICSLNTHKGRIGESSS